jgi:hypothetical protein
MIHFFQQVVAELRQNPRFALGIISRVKGSPPKSRAQYVQKRAAAVS